MQKKILGRRLSRPRASERLRDSFVKKIQCGLLTTIDIMGYVAYKPHKVQSTALYLVYKLQFACKTPR